MEGVRQKARWWRLLLVGPQKSLIGDHREGSWSFLADTEFGDHQKRSFG